MAINPNAARDYVNAYSAKTLTNQVHDILGLLQGVDVAVSLIRDDLPSLPVSDYVDENGSTKVVPLTQSYGGVINKMVWRKY